MKVLVFTTQVNLTGGLERLGLELAESLNSIDVHADILSQYDEHLSEFSISERKTRESVNSRIFYLGLTPSPSLLSFLVAIIRFRRILISNNFDCIEASGFTPSIIASLGTICLKVTVLIGVHANFQNNRYIGPKFFLWRLILRFVKHTFFYAVSKSVALDWIKYTKTNPQRTHVVFNSINKCFYNVTLDAETRKIFRESICADADAKLILVVGRLMKSKGIDLVYDAIKDILVSDNLHLVYVGRADGSESADDAIFLQDIRDEISCAPWSSRVHFLGQRYDIPEIMASSDLLVHPARYEGFGLILAEALAVGLPIIASNVGGIPEVLHETDSILFEIDDINGLRDSIISVLKMSPVSRSNVIQKGRLRSEYFRSGRRAEDIYKLFKYLRHERSDK